MKDIPQLGRQLFILAIGALGIQAFVCSTVVYELEPVPSWIPAHVVFANLTGFFLVATGIGLVINKLTRLAAISLAAMLSLWVLILHIPLLIPNPGPDLSFAFETLALSCVAWTLAAKSPPSLSKFLRWNAAVDSVAKLGRYGFAIALLAFCIVNFVYHDFIAGMIPGWIPAHQFWAYFTGIASFAAGISILTNIQARLALTLLGIMYGSWVLVIHIPYLAANPHDRGMWTDMFITLALSGGAWFIAGSMPPEKPVIHIIRNWVASVTTQPRNHD